MNKRNIPSTAANVSVASGIDMLFHDPHGARCWGSPRLSILAVCVSACFLAGCIAPRPNLDWKTRLGETAEAKVLKVFARGAHVYVCARPLDGKGSPEWRLSRVEADLYDECGRLVGRQSSEAAWEAVDKSLVTGTVLEKTDSPTCGAVPWALFAARSAPRKGLFANLSHVERIYTWGGRAPSKMCPDSSEGVEVRVPFGATYCFHARENAPGEVLALAGRPR